MIRAGPRTEHTRRRGIPRKLEREADLLKGSPDLLGCLRKEVTERRVFGRENIAMPAETSHLVKFVLPPLLLLVASSSGRRARRTLSWGLKGRNLRRRGLCVFSSGQEALLRTCSVYHNSHAHSSSCICRAPPDPTRPTRIRRWGRRQGCLQVPLLPFSVLP